MDGDCYQAKTSPPNPIPSEFPPCTPLLPWRQEVGLNNSVATCQQSCSSQGFPYMGVKDTTWCDCGHRPPDMDSKVPLGECNSSCPGNPGEKCGGQDGRMNVYKIIPGLENTPLQCRNQICQAQSMPTLSQRRISHRVVSCSQIWIVPGLQKRCDLPNTRNATLEPS